MIAMPASTASAMPRLPFSLQVATGSGSGNGEKGAGVSTAFASAAPNAFKGNAKAIPSSSSSSSSSYQAPPLPASQFQQRQQRQQQQQCSVLVCGNQVEAQRFIHEVTSAYFPAQPDTAAATATAAGSGGGGGDRSLCITCGGSSERVALQDLRRLTLSNVRLTQADHFLGRVTMLTHVNLSFNRLHDVSTLSLLPQLEVLDISHNKILSLDALRSSLALRTLRCHDNAVESLEPLLEMKNLTELWVSNNSVDWLEFVYVMPLLSLHTLVKFGNPADDKDKIDLFIQALRPTLQILDGISLVQEAANDRFDKDEGIASIALQREGVAFLRSTDGRVMLAQAQANLPRHQRERLQASEGSILRLEYQSATGRHNNNSSTSDAAHGGATAGQGGTSTRGMGQANIDYALGVAASRPPPPVAGAAAGAAAAAGGGETVYHRGRKLRPAAEHRSRSPSHSRSPSERERNRDPQSHQQHSYVADNGNGNDDDSRDDHVRSSGYGQKKRSKNKSKASASGGGAGGPFPPQSGVQMFQAKRRGGGGGAAANADSAVIGRASDTSTYSGAGQSNGNGKMSSKKYGSVDAAYQQPDGRNAVGDSGSESESGRSERTGTTLSLSPLPNHHKKHKDNIGQGISSSSSSSSGNNNANPVRLLRFGDNGAVVDLVHNTEEATVALCLYANNDGYARWQRGAGPVAISFEGGKLFGSYKNGSLAVILDKDGNGSVMDAQGHNVLLLTSGAKAGDGVATAKVMEPKSGRLTAEYRQGDASQGKNAKAVEKEKHSWKLNGLLVDFLPHSWELLVRFSNERMICEFSSAQGGRLLKEKGNSSQNNEGASTGAGVAGVAAVGGGVSNLSSLSESGSGGGGGIGGGGLGYSAAHARAHPLAQQAQVQSKSNARLTTEEHEAVRKDVGDILSNLDSLLKGLEMKGAGKDKGKGRGGAGVGAGAGAGAGVKGRDKGSSGRSAAREKR